ncbi:MAG: DUF502 domain-containing protein [Candidatus Omnitrophica bacterium]|nr:DUF502 domain-containing protein [Candidatus Omnitrophota bacterium]MDD5355787.1 DUF502 domain-containing protein [Candidatus Omnitrophota bacterium]
MKRVRKYIITGSLIVLPIVISVFLFLWLFKFLDGILGRYINNYLMNNYGYAIPGLGIILAFVLIFFVGFSVTHLVNKKVLLFFENWFIRFPVIKQIYPAVKQIVHFLFTDPKANFRKTVLVEFPRKGIYSIGFVTNNSCAHFNEKAGREMVNIFLPIAPSPLSGYLIFVPKDEIIAVDISVEDALKMIISGGLLNPSIS